MKNRKITKLIKIKKEHKLLNKPKSEMKLKKNK